MTDFVFGLVYRNIAQLMKPWDGEDRLCRYVSSRFGWPVTKSLILLTLGGVHVMKAARTKRLVVLAYLPHKLVPSVAFDERGVPGRLI